MVVFLFFRVLIVAMALLVVPFLPASNLFFRVGFVVAERILYLSSAGFCMLVVLGAKQLSAKPQFRQVYRTPFYTGHTYLYRTPFYTEDLSILNKPFYTTTPFYARQTLL